VEFGILQVRCETSAVSDASFSRRCEQPVANSVPNTQPLNPFYPNNLRVSTLWRLQIVSNRARIGRLSSSRIVESSDAGVRCEYLCAIARSASDEFLHVSHRRALHREVGAERVTEDVNASRHLRHD
jgi:hypothetical protein